MFSFFKRTKKDSTSQGNAKDKRITGAGDNKEQSDSEMCKNNLTTQNPDLANLQGKAVPALPNNLPQESAEITNVPGEVTALCEKTTIDSERKRQKMTDVVAESTPLIPAAPTVSYVIRRQQQLQQQQQHQDNPRENKSSGVKPCGHGTTAVSPHVPVLANKNNDTRTPPASPKLEGRKFWKIHPQEKITAISENGEILANGGDTIMEAKKSDTVSQSKCAEALVESVKTKSNLLVNGSGDNDADKKNLINQEAKFQGQLNDLSKQLSIRDAEANKLRFQMEELQRDVFVKSAGMDRLQAELQAAQKESEIVRLRIRHLEHDLSDFREKNNSLTTQLDEKTETYSNYENEARLKITHLENVIRELEIKIKSLETQLEELRREKEQLEQQHLALLAERDEEKKKVAEVLEQASLQKKDIEQKWKQDFEKLRTINIMKEQQLLDDFEWKLREVHQTCKKRLEEKDKSMEERLQDAYKEAEKRMEEAEQMMSEVEAMKSYESEIQQLRGLTADQAKALQDMIDQQEQMRQAEQGLKNEAKRLRTMIEMEKENLQHMQMKHHQEIVDKERYLKQTLQDKRMEIAMYWEERLLTECGRLKSELEQIHSEEKHFAMETIRREKEEEFENAKRDWEKKLQDCLKEVEALKKALIKKDEYFHDEVVRTQHKTDQDLLDLRRLMDKIDMSHHNRFEKLMLQHEEELERINEETEKRIRDIEDNWQDEVTSLRTNLDLVREEMERESQQKIESLIEQHRTELDAQWDNLIRQKSEAVELVEDEYVTKYKTLEEQFYTQQKSHEAREIELLKTIDSLKNELSSKASALDDMHNNVETLEGGIQVLNQEIAQQGDQLMKAKKETEHKLRSLQDTINKLHDQQEQERETSRLKLMNVQKQSQETIDHLQRKCQCLTKLFEEVRLRYERRESRQEDLNIISDLRQVIAEQEKDLACLNEEKRYFQMRLMNLDRLDESTMSGDEDAFEDAVQSKPGELNTPAYPSALSIPPTIPECDE